MNDLLERLEAMGRRGGLIAVTIAATSVALGAALSWVSVFFVDPSEGGRWTIGALRFAVLCCGVVAMPTALVGIRLLTQRHYPSAAEVFPAKSVAEITAALQDRDAPLCVCTRCRILLPAAFSTGSCPVCASSVEYHEVHDDEDAKMVLYAMS